MARKRTVPVASVTPARIAGPVAVTFAPTNGAPAESVTLTVIVSVAAELVAGRGRGAAGGAVAGGAWAGRGDSTGGVWAAAAAARTGTPPTPADTVTRPVTRRAVAGRIMPVTYIDLRAGRQREDANRPPRAGLSATSLASANRAGEKVVEVRAG